jgi:hypothetical protein
MNVHMRSTVTVCCHAHKARLAAVVHSITMLFLLLAFQPPPR